MAFPARVALFMTCLGGLFYPEAGATAVRLLPRLGTAVDFPCGQTCCGQAACNAGFQQQAREVARRNLALLASAAYIVIPSGSCTVMWRIFSPELFADDPVLGTQAEALASRQRWQSALLDALEIDTVLQPHGVTVHTTVPPTTPQNGATAALTTRRRERRAVLTQADLGLSGVDYVIAETGTLVLQALPGQMRGVSLAPPVPVAVARASHVLETRADFLLLTQAAGADLQHQLTSCTSFITGPSRTADMELQLAVGVHGPKELHLVLLDEPTDA
ncbi:MAG: LUD domain-containing protein [Candidatus Tectimicrobiota bacterium]